MADEIRTPPEFLTALQALFDAKHGAAVFAALAVELQSRQDLDHGPAPPWTLASALAELNVPERDGGLFGALRLLEGAQPDKRALGYSTRAEDEAVRIDQTLLLGFAAREVDGVEAAAGAQSRPRLAQSAIGLLGPNGPLPFRWTEHAHSLINSEYRSQSDPSFHAWLNVIQRRQIALLYRAWSDAQAVTAADRPGGSHPIADRLQALAGLALSGLRDRDGIADGFKMAFAAVFSRRVRNPGPLGMMLSVYFDTPVCIEEFAPHWMDIPEDQHSVLGLRFMTLGGDAIAGMRVWDATTRFRIVVGPLSMDAYRRFLPSGQAYAELRDLVSLYVGAEYQWELVPVLVRGAVPFSWIGNPEWLLGWSSWLGVRYKDVDGRDLVLHMTPRLGPDARAAPEPKAEAEAD
jgi:type VI secretion system protein ImpH